MKTRFNLFILGGILLIVLGLAGCGTPTPTPTLVPVHAPQVDYTAQLAQLKTYRARAHIDIYPAPDTGLDKAHLEVEVDAVNAPHRARRTTIRGLRSMAKPEERRKTADVLKLVQVGGDLYISTGTTWLKTPAQNNPEQGFMDPGTLVPHPEGLTLAESDVEVNGIRSDHYTFDSPEMLAYLTPEERAQVERVQGDVWIARDGHYIVRYRARIEGRGFRFDFSPQPFAGRVDVAYDVYHPNEPLTIERPQRPLGASTPEEEKPIVLDGFGNTPFPLPADASVVMSTHQLVVFDTPLSADEVDRFYVQALENAGWKQGERTVGANGTVKEVWTRPGYELRLTLVPGKSEDAPTHVIVGVNPR